MPGGAPADDSAFDDVVGCALVLTVYTVCDSSDLAIDADVAVWWTWCCDIEAKCVSSD